MTRPGETALTYTYDIAGRLYDVKQDTTIIASYDYDRIGRLKQIDADNRAVKYDYDILSRRTKLVYPDDTNVSYEYDALSRLTKVKYQGDTVAEFDWDELSRMTKVAYANGQYEEYDYDLGDNIEQVSYSPSSMNSYDYLYDKVGNVTGKSYDSLTYDFTYDKTYQLTEADYPGSSDDWLYHYDKVNNRTITVNNSTQTNYLRNILNQYTSVAAVAYSYDSKGNLTNDGTYKYEYDCENRLTTVKNQSDITIATYSYDYAGRRISKLTTIDQRLTTYVYDGPHIIAEYEGTVLKKKFIYGPGIDFPIAMFNIDGETEIKYYYFRDALGSVVALLNNDGVVVEAYSYEAFGKPKVHIAAGADNKWLTSDDSVSSVSSVANCIMFTARQWDSESGLYDYRNRMYNPQLGRFLQPDPIRYDDGLNLYAYVGNNPINWVDPYGLWKAAGHSDQTTDYMRKAKFSGEEINRAVRSNKRVDRLSNQGNDPPHYMPGTRDDAERIKRDCMNRAVECAKRGDMNGAMDALGEGLHTVQDKAAHYDQDAGWKQHRDGTEPDNPGKHPNEYRNSQEETEKYIKEYRDKTKDISEKKS